MKKIILSIFVLATLSTASFAQSSPFEWQAGENTKIKLGGFVRVNINSDFDGSVTGNDFISSTIPSTDNLSDAGRLNFDPSATRLSLQITQSTDAVGDIKVYVEGDFRGTGNTIRLRQAYVEMLGFIAGQAWSFMSDLSAQAPTVDINGVGSRTFLRTHMFGYRRSFSDFVSAGISVEIPSLTTSYIDGYSAVNQTVPNVPIYIQAKSGLGHIKAAAVFRSLQYCDNATESRVSQLGWGAQLSGSLNVTEGITLFGQGIYGEGINNYISDLASLEVNLMPSEGDQMEATQMGGASLGISAKLSKKWSFALSGSHTRNMGDATYFAGDYKYTNYCAAALFFSPAPRVTLATEYLNGSRTNFGGEASGAQRLSLSIKYAL